MGLQSTASDQILFEIDRGFGRIYLNRPKALNALNLDMVRGCAALLDQWKSDDRVEAVLITSLSEKAFCAGGDLRSVHEAYHRKDHAFLEALFREEYTINYTMRTYPKPYVALIDGIAMGGGLGASLHGDLAVVTERAHLAMPEVNIGYFPDVGAGHFLNQSSYHQGFYLGLTGNHFGPKEAIDANIAQFYVAHEEIPAITDGLLELKQKDHESIKHYLKSVHKSPGSSEVFSQTNFMEPWFEEEEFSSFWHQVSQSEHPVARTMHDILRKRSPLAVVLTWYQLKRCRAQDFKTIMQYEFSLSRTFINSHDFVEGIRATIVDKDRTPNWKPTSLENVTEKEVKEILNFIDVPTLSL